MSRQNFKRDLETDRLNELSGLQNMRPIFLKNQLYFYTFAMNNLEKKIYFQKHWNKNIFNKKSVKFIVWKLPNIVKRNLKGPK